MKPPYEVGARHKIPCEVAERSVRRCARYKRRHPGAEGHLISSSLPSVWHDYPEEGQVRGFGSFKQGFARAATTAGSCREEGLNVTRIQWGRSDRGTTLSGASPCDGRTASLRTLQNNPNEPSVARLLRRSFAVSCAARAPFRMVQRRNRRPGSSLCWSTDVEEIASTLINRGE